MIMSRESSADACAAVVNLILIRATLGRRFRRRAKLMLTAYFDDRSQAAFGH